MTFYELVDTHDEDGKRFYFCNKKMAERFKEVNPEFVIYELHTLDELI